MTQGSTTLGRLPSVQVGKPVLHDSPEKQMQAVLSQQDQLIALVKAMAVQLDAASVAGGPYNTAAIQALAPIALTL